MDAWTKNYFEISSCSQCGTFQARRLKAVCSSNNHKDFVHTHTLNGTGVAIEKILAAILENYHDNNVLYISKVLQNYMGIDK
jgi:seryl-tRNA synthetase